MSSPEQTRVEVVVIGAGFAGIGAGIRLREAGIDDFVILEKADSVGGAWQANTYPDVAVDIPMCSYAFSFEPDLRSARTYPKGHEIQAYAERCVDKYELRQRLRLDTEVTGTAFDEEQHLWEVQTSRGPLRARFLIVAHGPLVRPRIPAIEGLDTFAGKVMHSARWDHEHDLDGERIGVIGTGSSAVQLVPAIAERVKQLHVFQRTPVWVVPKLDLRIPRLLQVLFRVMPLALLVVRFQSNVLHEAIAYLAFRLKMPALVRLIERLSLKALRKQVPDDRVRAQLTPQYRYGCKRPAISSNYHRTFARDNVELVTADIVHITETGISTADGEHRELDTLVLATGFNTFERGANPPFPIIGRNGVDLADYFETHRHGSYEGVTMPGWPNSFAVLSTTYSLTALYFPMIENSTIHAVRCIREMYARGATCVEIKPEPHAAFVRDMQRRQATSVFLQGDCRTSTFLDQHGDAPVFRPSTGLTAWWRARHFPMDHYSFTTSQ
ncbi:NAD(P)/FAD-dependent oxidoreductase [Nocardia sp. NPDC006630]|uniref:flavin-containing monooxygenase n=1 Tax=Nocardia sp. NPDC006630 TaxID=3157181 RepID=UPI0033B0745A